MFKADTGRMERQQSQDDKDHEANRLKHFQQLGKATLVTTAPGRGISSILSNGGGGGRGRGMGGMRRTTVVGLPTMHKEGVIEAVSRDSFGPGSLSLHSLGRSAGSLDDLMNDTTRGRRK